MLTQKKKIKALIVSPYLDHLGGGERYMLSIAETLEKQGYQINFAWDNKQEIAHLCELLNIHLANPVVVPQIKQLYSSKNPIGMLMATRPYDVVVYLSDGSLPMLGGKKNIVHMQVPFHDVGGRSLKNQVKKMTLSSIIVNSEFTKRIVDREYDINATVVYPPVPHIEPAKKEKIILSVGRFEPSLNAKKQDILINAFKKISKKIPSWKLVLAGASASDDWITHLEKLSEGFPIEFCVNASYQQLTALYSTAAIYWHAAGYGVDEYKNPELTEHFGISTVEAISAGCIPLVVGRGGQPEIVTNPDLKWTEIDELVAKTQAVIGNLDPAMYLAGIDISEFSQESFTVKIKALIS